MSTIVHYQAVPGYSQYQAGDDGNIRQRIDQNVWITCHPIKTNQGYLVISITGDNGIRRQERIHRLVLLAFIGAPSDANMIACHNNGLRYDNRLCNLRWDSFQGNESDKEQHGTKLKGEHNHQHRLTEIEVISIKEMLNNGISTTDLAHAFGVSRTAIHWIKVGRNWTNV